MVNQMLTTCVTQRADLAAFPSGMIQIVTIERPFIDAGETPFTKRYPYCSVEGNLTELINRHHLLLRIVERSEG